MNSHPISLHDVKSLSPTQKTGLKKNNFKDLSDVVLTPPGDLAKKLKVSLGEAQAIVEIVCKEVATTSLNVVTIEESGADKFSTGDVVLDRVIGGGVRTGMVWELVGESASGKTQFALQLSLLVQVRPMLGGLSGSACYLTTHAKLPTNRLNQLILDHPLLSPSVCSLSDVHTIGVPTIELLLHTLRVTFPALQDDLRKDAVRKPARLIVIDSISALFRTSEKSSSSTLFERSKALYELSHIMHRITATDKIAFVVVNDVMDVFNDFYPGSLHGTSKSEIIYRDQSKWFNAAHFIPSESAKEACLGLVWANQLNVRIMLTRTNRRRYQDDPFPSAKRRQAHDGSVAVIIPPPSSRGGGDEVDQTILLRRFSVVFTSVSTPGSVDFVITNAGVSAFPDEVVSHPLVSHASKDSGRSTASIMGNRICDAHLPTSSSDARSSQTRQFVNARAAVEGPTSGSSVDSQLEAIPSTFPELDELDDEGLYWEEFDELPLPDIDFDGLERHQVEEDTRASQSTAFVGELEYRPASM